MYKRYIGRLTDEERQRIETLLRRGRAHARSLLYARILLKADASEDGPAWTDERIADALETSADTVARERRRFVEDGLEVALMAKKPGKPRRRVLEVRRLAEEDYPQAEKIRLVVDNLSTRTAAALYEAFDPERARRLARRVEFCYTPVHGSWLNMAEIEISALVRQCLGKRRLPDEETLRRETKTWAAERNRLGASVHWHFTMEDAHQAAQPLPRNGRMTEG